MSDIKNMAASVRARLLNLAKKENINFNQILLLYMQERLLYRLSVSKYKNKFFLKGGVLILSVTNFKTRPTKDLDFLVKNISNDLDYIQNIFKEICKIECNDGVSFNSDNIKVENITEGAEYEGVRIKIETFLGDARKLLQLDLGFGDVITPKSKNLEYPVLLNQETPEINAYSLESVIAEKFEAMIKLSMINSRMKDFYDLYIISENNSFDGRVLQEAIFNTLQRRATSLKKNPLIFTEEFIKNERKKTMWENYLKRIGKKDIKFENVMERIDKFLSPVYKHIIKEKEFFKIWNNNKIKWEKQNN